MIAHAPLAECIKDAALVSLCAFGGFSGAAQTASVISNTDLSVRRYLYVKFRQAVIAGITPSRQSNIRMNMLITTMFTIPVITRSRRCME